MYMHKFIVYNFIAYSTLKSIFFLIHTKRLVSFNTRALKTPVHMSALLRRQAECAKTARIQMALPPGGKAPPAGAPSANLYEELGDGSM